VVNYLEDNSNRLFKTVSPVQAFLNKQALGDDAVDQLEDLKKNNDGTFAKQFIMNTSDENTLLYALAHAGQFDQEETQTASNQWRIYSR